MCVCVCLSVRVYFCAMAAVRVRFRYKNYIYSESAYFGECSGTMPEVVGSGGGALGADPPFVLYSLLKKYRERNTV